MWRESQGRSGGERGKAVATRWRATGGAGHSNHDERADWHLPDGRSGGRRPRPARTGRRLQFSLVGFDAASRSCFGRNRFLMLRVRRWTIDVSFDTAVFIEGFQTRYAYKFGGGALGIQSRPRRGAAYERRFCKSTQWRDADGFAAAVASNCSWR